MALASGTWPKQEDSTGCIASPETGLVRIRTKDEVLLPDADVEISQPRLLRDIYYLPPAVFLNRSYAATDPICILLNHIFLVEEKQDTTLVREHRLRILGLSEVRIYRMKLPMFNDDCT